MDPRTSPGDAAHGPAYRSHTAVKASPAAFFDLDKTVIAGSCTLAYSRPLHRLGMIDLRTAARAACARCVYALSGAGHDRMEKMRQELSRMVHGWDAGAIRDIVVEGLESIVRPLIYGEALALIERHRAAGQDIVLVSSSGQDVVEPIGELLGVDHVISTRMVLEDGRYTGEIAFYAYADNKVTAIRELAARHRYDLSASYAYSDSVTDLPLLRSVGHPHVVNPDRGLRKAAAAHGWPILRFERPEGKQRGVLDEIWQASRPGTALVVAGLAAGLLWAARRRPGRGNGTSVTFRKEK
jgi:HAD superfamily hydrolase (TIGR01490 family)